MRERSESLLKGLCLILAALWMAQLARIVFRPNPLSRLVIPSPPTLSSNAPSSSTTPETNAAGASKLPPGRRPGGAAAGDLSPAIQARIERITQSEALGPVIRPLPMALLGIAGPTAFLRGPNGQSGLVKEGAEFDGIKLIQIGVNRVLVEQGGQKKELTIFSGYGGNSLMPKSTENSQ